jgi:pyrroline-5-carboxylate reductase
MQPTFAFIGGGNMGRALIGGLLQAGHAASKIRVADAFAPSREQCRDLFSVQVYEQNLDAVVDADVVVFAVKPQQLRDVAGQLADTASDSVLYLSIAAGITIEHLQRWLGPTRSIVRCMPNTPALVGSGAAALCANARVSSPQRALADSLLGAVGSAQWLEDEGLMDAVTAVSGSGPAYFFLFIELIEKIAGELGLPQTLARSLAIDTALGASRLAHSSEQAPAQLREQVTSAGGTTASALAVFEQRGLEDLVREALTAARDRSIALARQVES